MRTETQQGAALRRLRTRALVALAMSAALLAPLQPARAAGAWEPIREAEGREGISSWVRAVDEAPVKQFRGVTEVRRPMTAVLALLADIPNLRNWIYQCKQMEYADSSPDERTYARFRGIWPAGDRDVLLRTTVTQFEDRSVLVESRNIGGLPEQPGYVRIPYLRNTFRLTPLPGGWTRVEFETVIDPGGWVPGWIANLISLRAPQVTLEGLHREIGKPRYQIRSVNELPPYYFRGGQIVMPEAHLKTEGASPP